MPCVPHLGLQTDKGSCLPHHALYSCIQTLEECSDLISMSSFLPAEPLSL